MSEAWPGRYSYTAVPRGICFTFLKTPGLSRGHRRKSFLHFVYPNPAQITLRRDRNIQQFF
jgi:hypothetical protein